MPTLLALLTLLAVCAIGCAATPPPHDPPRDTQRDTPRDRPRDWYVGGDISMLPELEKAGAVYRAPDGTPGDALAILRAAGSNVFRLRVFVEPSDDFNATWGAVQDLPSMVALGRRVKATGAALLIDLHYSDRWADPKHQAKPAAWQHLPFDQLEAKVQAYTTEVLAAFDTAGARPDFVQIGNEITPGMLWPDGRLEGDDPAAWDRLARLVSAGCRAVRAVSTPAHPIRTVVHVHGGGTPGLPNWFFARLLPRCLDVDVLAVSFYPAWDDTLPALRTNLTELFTRHHKPVWVVETSYPHKPIPGLDLRNPLPYPTTPQGQADFTRDLVRLVRDLPDGLGLGVVWWYPEAHRAGDLHIYRDAAESLFDDTARLLPAARALTATP